MNRQDGPVTGRSLDDYISEDATDTLLLELSAAANRESPGVIQQYQVRRQAGQLSVAPTVELELALVQQQRFEVLLTRLFS
ncbi:MAG TPA: hypothetical protein VG992_04160 [Candidatus Saccharimonadales bacterium]|nr:hypothetical protein [Candidatus Saccharimonadales bacterium]